MKAPRDSYCVGITWIFSPNPPLVHPSRRARAGVWAIFRPLLALFRPSRASPGRLLAPGPRLGPLWRWLTQDVTWIRQEETGDLKAAASPPSAHEHLSASDYSRQVLDEYARARSEMPAIPGGMTR